MQDSGVPYCIGATFSDFLYNHLIKGTTSLKKLQSKYAYERAEWAHDVIVKF